MPGQVNRGREFSFEVVYHLGTYGHSSRGWSKEANIIEWNGGPAKLDLREWDPNHEKMSRGITLHKPEMLQLLQILNRYYGPELREHRKVREEWMPQAEMKGNAVICAEDCTDEATGTMHAETPKTSETEDAIKSESTAESEGAAQQETEASMIFDEEASDLSFA